jgi:ribosomal protein S18 acetylase RimI-like enzyme
MDSNSRPTASLLFPAQHTEAARALGRAFINDPTFNTIMPEPREPVERARRLTIFFEGILGIQRRSGEPVFGVTMNGKAVAAAVVDGTGEVSVPALVIGGLFRLPKVIQGLGLSGTMRGIQVMNELSKNHPHEPHIYLNFLGVDPEFQRQYHCGSVLLEHLRLLATQRPSLCGVYLETATEENVAYYSARGFEVLGELRPLGCRMWRMLQRRK